MKSLEERVDDLEIRLNQAQDLIDELNKIIYRQQTQISQLAQRSVDLQGKLESSAPPVFRSLLDEIPPHY